MHALTLRVPAAAVDGVGEALEALGALSVSVEDADAGSDAEHPVFDEPGVGATGTWQRAIVAALFASETAADEAAAAVSASQAGLGVGVLAITPVADDDWVRTSQAQFGATEIAAGFWIVPSWCDVPATAQRTIRLDPGRAFGTGTHPTTRMCLRWISAHAAADAGTWSRVLDYGCGSGVLAIAARLFGGRDVDAVDIDPAAIEAADANAAVNDTPVRCGPVDSVHGRYALVLANILATPLKLMAPLLGELLEADGRLLLSGILVRQANELREAYAPWVALDVADEEDGWILLSGRRSSAARVA